MFPQTTVDKTKKGEISEQTLLPKRSCSSPGPGNMASSAVSPDVIAAIVKSTKEVLTTVLIGFTISTT